MKTYIFIVGKELPERITDIRCLNKRGSNLVDEWWKKVIIIFINQCNEEPPVIL